MFENDIKFIADHSLSKIKKLGSFVTLETLNKADLHPAILRYISAELDYLIHQDRKKLLSKSLFDYSGPETAKHLQIIGQELKKRKKISFEDIKKLVMQAVSFNANFTVRPKWSLTKLVFNEEDSKDAEEIKLVLNYLYYYEYLKIILLEYFDKKKIGKFSQKEFGELLDKIDSQVLSKDPEKFIDNALYSMSDLFNTGGTNKNKLSPSYAEIFFKEKGLTKYLNRYETSSLSGRKEPVDVDEIRNILYSKPELAPVENADNLHGDEPSENMEEKPASAIEEVPEVQEEETQNVEIEDNLKEELETKETEEEVALPEIEEEKIKEEPVQTKDDEEEIKELLLSDEPEIESVIDEDLLAFYESELKDIEEGNSDEKKEEPASSQSGIEIVKDEDQKDVSDQLGMEFELEEDKKIDTAETKENDEPSENEIEITETEEENYFEDLTEHAQDSGDKDPDPGYYVEDEEPEEIIAEKESYSAPAAETYNRGKDLFDYISDKDMDKIVQSVFNDDREDFASTMERVTECSNYDEATEILKSVFVTYRVNPYTRDAVTLTNAVSNYFQQA